MLHNSSSPCDCKSERCSSATNDSIYASFNDYVHNDFIEIGKKGSFSSGFPSNFALSAFKKYIKDPANFPFKDSSFLLRGQHRVSGSLPERLEEIERVSNLKNSSNESDILRDHWLKSRLTESLSCHSNSLQTFPGFNSHPINDNLFNNRLNLSHPASLPYYYWSKMILPSDVGHCPSETYFSQNGSPYHNELETFAPIDLSSST